MNKTKLALVGSLLALATSAPLRAVGELDEVEAGIAGMGTIILASVGAIITAGIALKVVPMGIRFLGRVWKAITA